MPRRFNAAWRNVPRWLATAAALLACGTALAQGDARFKISGGASYGIGVRTSDPDPALLFVDNARAAGLASSNTAGRNQDDGNMNYRKGDVFTNVVTGFADLSLAKGSASGLLRIQGWHDFELQDGAVPWGHSPNGFASGEPLSDASARPRGKFSNAILSDAWVRGAFHPLHVPVTVTAGSQSIGWRGYGLVAGPLAEIDPADAMARNRPGSFGEQASIPIMALRAEFQLPEGPSVDAFLQFGFHANQAPLCGTFFSQADRGEDGCALTMVNAGAGTRSDRALQAANHTIGISKIEDPTSGGQFGVRTLWEVAPRTQLAATVARFHSRTGYLNLVKSKIPGNNPFAENDPRNPQTQIAYPKGIGLLALEFSRDLRPGKVYASVGYSPNQPIGYPTGEVTQAFTAPVSVSSLFRAQERATAPGGVFEGWDRRKISAWQLGWVHPIRKVLGAATVALRAEVNARFVHDLPDPAHLRYARPEVFGIGPINGACAAGASALTCTNEGYVSRRAWGYVLQAVANYPKVLGSFALRPRVVFADNVKGYSYDGLLKEGRKILSIGLDAVRESTTFSVGLVRRSGGTYDNANDRNYIVASGSIRF